jgi:DNA-binding MarR family transcriptional regulator
MADQLDTLAVAGELRVVLGQLTRRLRQQADTGDFTRSQLAVLARLERDGAATMTALAHAEGIRPQSMGVIIGVLQDAGMVAGTPDPSDGRKTVLALTDAARERFATGRLAREDWLFRAIRAELDPAEQAELAACIALLKRLADS